MTFTDAHLHLSELTLDNLNDMALAGIRTLIAPVQLPVHHAISKEGMLDIWDMQIEEFVPRAKGYLIDAYSMIGMSMVCTPDPKDVDYLATKLEEYMSKPSVVGIGEVGFELNSPTNKDEDFQRMLYEVQLDVAKKTGKVVDVHTSFAPERKIKYTKECIELAKKHNFPMDKLVIDHVSEDNLQIVLDAGAWAAITVQPWRGITPEMAASMIVKANSDKVFVDSDSDGGDPSDVLSVAKVAYAMEVMGADKNLIEAACSTNAKKAYGIL